MKFTCNQQILAKALNTVSKAVSNRTTIPILKGIMITVTEEGKLILTASDLEISIKKEIDANVEEPGSFVVMAKLFSDIVRKLPNEEIVISDEEAGSVVLKRLDLRLHFRHHGRRLGLLDVQRIQTQLDEHRKYDNGDAVITYESIQKVKQKPHWFCYYA